MRVMYVLKDVVTLCSTDGVDRQTLRHTFDNSTRMPTYKGPCVCFCSRRTLTSRKCRNNAVRGVGGIFFFSFLFLCNVLQYAIFAEVVVT
jgi:hypothetical protein